jgi:hypothetical protein
LRVKDLLLEDAFRVAIEKWMKSYVEGHVEDAIQQHLCLHTRSLDFRTGKKHLRVFFMQLLQARLF